MHIPGRLGCLVGVYGRGLWQLGHKHQLRLKGCNIVTLSDYMFTANVRVSVSADALSSYRGTIIHLSGDWWVAARV